MDGGLCFYPSRNERNEIRKRNNMKKKFEHKENDKKNNVLCVLFVEVLRI